MAAFPRSIFEDYENFSFLFKFMTALLFSKGKRYNSAMNSNKGSVFKMHNVNSYANTSVHVHMST
jgi:hypothetical protein